MKILLPMTRLCSHPATSRCLHRPQHCAPGHPENPAAVVNPSQVLCPQLPRIWLRLGGPFTGKANTAPHSRRSQQGPTRSFPADQRPAADSKRFACPHERPKMEPAERGLRAAATGPRLTATRTLLLHTNYLVRCLRPSAFCKNPGEGRASAAAQAAGRSAAGRRPPHTLPPRPGPPSPNCSHLERNLPPTPGEARARSAPILQAAAETSQNGALARQLGLAAPRPGPAPRPAASGPAAPSLPAIAPAAPALRTYPAPTIEYPGVTGPPSPHFPTPGAPQGQTGTYLPGKQSPRSRRRSCQPPSSSSHAAAALIHGPRRRSPGWGAAPPGGNRRRVVGLRRAGGRAGGARSGRACTKAGARA